MADTAAREGDEGEVWPGLAESLLGCVMVRVTLGSPVAPSRSGCDALGTAWLLLYPALPCGAPQTAL